MISRVVWLQTVALACLVVGFSVEADAALSQDSRGQERQGLKTEVIQFRSLGDHEFKAKIYRPESKKRNGFAVLMIGGGYGNDLDWSVPGKIKTRTGERALTISGKSHADAPVIAKMLTESGFVVMHYSTIPVCKQNPLRDSKALEAFDQARLFELSKTALQKLREKEGVANDKIVLLGHSLGAVRAANLAASNQGIAGMILLAAAQLTRTAANDRGRNMNRDRVSAFLLAADSNRDEICQVQEWGQWKTRNRKPVHPLAAQSFKSLDFNKDQKLVRWELAAGFARANRKQFSESEMRRRDPVGLTWTEDVLRSRAELPALILYGDLDFAQAHHAPIIAESIRSWKRGSGVVLKTLPELGHQLSKEREGRVGPIAGEALNEIAIWLNRFQQEKDSNKNRSLTLNQKANGYRGIWYSNQPSGDEYAFKYSGGLGTYCAKHRPFAIYSKKANKTFFCYGGAKPGNNRALLHMVSYFDHKTKTVPRPTILLDKKTNDAHDNPVVSMDDQGYIWIFSTSHGRVRPSFIHRSVKPYDIEEFTQIRATRFNENRDPVVIDNFSYMQIWNRPGKGFAAFFTRYQFPAARTICFMNSKNGERWSVWKKIAAIEQGHYQVSGVGKSKLATMFNYHPADKGLNWRTNLYYVETKDGGRTWESVEGKELKVPLRKPDNPALVRNYQKDGLNVYLKDIKFDELDRPLLLFVTSKGYQAGPKNDPRTWTLAKWSGTAWSFHKIAISDNNYDMGELIVDSDEWKVIAPTEKGPQPYNPGGEVAIWVSKDRGVTWKRDRILTKNSERNHTFVRNVLNAHPDFVSIWADGNPRKPSESRLYFCDSEGKVYVLPKSLRKPTKPKRLNIDSSK